VTQCRRALALNDQHTAVSWQTAGGGASIDGTASPQETGRRRAKPEQRCAAVGRTSVDDSVDRELEAGTHAVELSPGSIEWFFFVEGRAFDSTTKRAAAFSEESTRTHFSRITVYA